MKLRYLSRADVERVALPLPEIIAALEEMFVEKGHGRVEMPPKPGIHPLPDAFIHAMPAHIPALGATGMKWISGYPQNQDHGLPYITGLLVLNDPETGVPIAVMDATWITAMRTGAVTAVAAKQLGRADSSTAGIVACGVQGRSNLEALACCFELERVHAFDVRREVAEKFAVDMRASLDLDVRVADSAREAVEGLDLVVTSGPILKHPEPVIADDWLAPGVFASAVDFDSYFTGTALAAADRLVTDDHAQFEHYREVGYFKDTPTPDADLGELAAGKRPGRVGDEERIVCIHLGLALDDMATAIRIYRRAVELGLGTTLPL